MDAQLDRDQMPGDRRSEHMLLVQPRPCRQRSPNSLTRGGELPLAHIALS